MRESYHYHETSQISVIYVKRKIPDLSIQDSLLLFLKLAIYQVKMHNRCVRIAINILANLFFLLHFFGNMCVLWVLWVILLAFICQYNAKDIVEMMYHIVDLKEFF